MSNFADINDTGKIPIGIANLDFAMSLPESEFPEVLIITGMSGAGRSHAGATLEDLGWYVIDNMPPRLITAMLKLAMSGGGIKKIACVVDVRSRKFFQELVHVLQELSIVNIPYRIIFLDASDAELVRRYESVRRPHPLQGDGRLLTGIQRERELLTALRKRSDEVIDTTHRSVHDLAREIRYLVGNTSEIKLELTVMSFGFKYGLPLDADHVADVRFIPNPYWVSELRHLTGKDKPVQEFVMQVAGARQFVERYSELIGGMVAGYEHELKPYVTIAIGCTGGKHRSVAIAEAISQRFRESGLTVRTIHRDLGRE